MLAVSAKKRSLKTESNNDNKRKPIRCHRRNRIGHIPAECWAEIPGYLNNNGQSRYTSGCDRSARLYSCENDGKSENDFVNNMGLISSFSSNYGRGKASNDIISGRPITIDNGASGHAIDDLNLFQTMEPVRTKELELADGIVAIPNLKRRVMLALSGTKLASRSVYYVHTLRLNKLSCSRVDERGWTTNITNGVCTLPYRQKRNRVMERLHINSNDGLYNATIIETPVVSRRSNPRTWNARHVKIMMRMPRSFAIIGCNAQVLKWLNT